MFTIIYFFQPQLKAAHVSVSKLFCLRTRTWLAVTPPHCAPRSRRAVLGLGMAPVLSSIQCCSPPNPWASPCHGFLLHSHATESCLSGLLKKKNLQILRANVLSASVHYSHISGISLPWHDFCCISREPFPPPLTFSL